MVCSACGRVVNFLQRHHKFHNTDWARKLYGKLMDDQRNIQYACYQCNVSHAGTKLTHWNELQFCEALAIMPRSKELTFQEAKNG